LLYLATDAIADVLQKDRRTIEQWQKAIGQKGQQFFSLDKPFNG